MAPITLRGPRDVLAVLPYQLGYHPSDSVVVIALHGGQVGLVARADLPPAGQEEVAVAALLPPLLRDPPDVVMLVGYEDDPGSSLAVLSLLGAALDEAGVRLADAVVVRDGRWFGTTCDEQCCPPEGQRLPDPAEIPAVAAFVHAERAPLADRGDLAGLVAGDLDACAGVAAAVAALRARRAAGRPLRRPVRVWGRIAAIGEDRMSVGDIAVADVAAACCSLRDLEWRDALIAWLAPGTMPLDGLGRDVVRAVRRTVPRPPVTTVASTRLQARLAELCRRVPDECADEAAAVCTLAGCVMWSFGQGALAREAVDRALRLRPGHRLARLLERMLDLGVRPGEGFSDRTRAEAG